MWELISFILFGFVMFCSGGVVTIGKVHRNAIERGRFEYDSKIYRIWKMEE